MDVLKNLMIMNEATIIYKEELGEDSNENKKIKEILEDEACFFKLDKNIAFKVIEKIGIAREKVEEVYNEVISKRVFYKLINDCKLNENDDNLKIKYEVYKTENLFKKRRNSSGE